MEKTKSTNPFAITLSFYYLYIRNKLNPVDLLKIVKKYKLKPQDLIKDLVNKYGDYFDIPTSVSQYEIEKIKSSFTVPKQYLELINNEFSTKLNYETKFDIYSKDFNALEALTKHTILGSNLLINPLDNMNKAKVTILVY